MKYISTRGGAIPVESAEAIKRGLCEDGGLYMPSELPTLTTEDLKTLMTLSYVERATFVLGKYLSDYTEEELLEDCQEAYSPSRFPKGATAIHSLSDMSLLELFHGPTCAFKDMALQIMPRLFRRALTKTNEERTALILVATSGDTGKAALEGYCNIDKIKIQVFYPTDGVSKIQKLQMQTQVGENVSVMAIRGNFDDAQSGVKRIFSNREFAQMLDEKGVFLSSANSINWGRLVPQIVYYVSAYCDMVKGGKIALGESIDVTVPTGNFGNIFACFMAKQMGLPIAKLICASNQNNVLTEFLSEGIYSKNRPFYKTISPSMDILISSNLERLLYLTLGTEKCRKYMLQLAECGEYRLCEEDFSKIREHFVGYCADEEETKKTIHELFDKEKYLSDTHTAVAVCCAKKYMREGEVQRKMLTVSTASPYKFASDVLLSLGEAPVSDSIGVLRELFAYSQVEIPLPLAELGGKEVRFSEVIGKEDMEDAVLAFAERK